MLQPRILAERRVVMRHVHRIVVPVLEAHHRQRGTIPHDDLDVVGIRRTATVIKHNGGPRISSYLDERVPEGRPLGALAPDRNHSRLVNLSLWWNRYDHRLFERSKCPRTDPVRR